jgi:hypothetical protein
VYYNEPVLCSTMQQYYVVLCIGASVQWAVQGMQWCSAMHAVHCSVTIGLYSKSSVLQCSSYTVTCSDGWLCGGPGQQCRTSFSLLGNWPLQPSARLQEKFRPGMVGPGQARQRGARSRSQAAGSMPGRAARRQYRVCKQDERAHCARLHGFLCIGPT